VKHQLNIAVLLALVLMLNACVALGKSREPRDDKSRPKQSDWERMRRKVLDLGVGHRVTVILKNGNEYYGAIGESKTESFDVLEVDLNQTINIPYTDVKKIRSGFGDPNKFNGKRWNPAWHIVALLVVVGVTVALVAAGSNARD